MSKICATPGCGSPAYKDSSGKVGKYCGRTHQGWGEDGCILCRKADKWADSKFCRRCDASTRRLGPVLIDVPKDNETFDNVANQFQQSWRHQTKCPKVRAIYKIVEDQQVVDRYTAHKDAVEARGKFIYQGLDTGNQQRRWHGTNRGCNLGDPGRTALCSSSNCSLCCIIRTSFDLSYAKKKTGWGRFGTGIYTSSTSSKSNDYSKNLVASKWKATMLVYVAAGKAKRYTTNQPTLTKPPPGFDSVIGEPSNSGPLNYDELVVYTNNAVCPAYLIMYDG